jgi:hypothetical protein
LDKFFRADNPRHAPAGEAEALCQPVDEEDVVEVDVDDVGGGGEGGPVAVGGVVVARVEFVEDEGGAVTADILDEGEFFGVELVAGWVARVGGQDYGGAAGELFGDFVGVNVVGVGSGEGDGYCCELES